MTVVRARTSSGARTGLRGVICGLTAALALLASACGNDNIDLGTPVITLTTDTASNFTSYIVTIDQITMTRQDGSVEPVLANPERIDLAQLSNFVELLEAPAFVTGTYVSAQFEIDYSTPVITVNVNGISTAASPVDTTGVAVTAQTFTVNFDPANPMVLTKGVSSQAAMYIDLEASNTINFSASPLTVTVKPVFAVNAKPVFNKPIRARGEFVIGDANSGVLTLNMRPLHDVLYAPLGALHAQTNAQTYYSLNGVSYVGAAGLAAAVKLQENEQIEVYGTSAALTDLSGITPVFAATAVYAGTSLESAIADHLTGVVSARSGNVLTLKGAALVDRSGNFGYADTATVTIAATTFVSQDGVIPATPLTSQSVSVGQFIDVSGQDTVDVSGNPLTLDATQGLVRLQSTPVWGTLAAAATAGSLSLNVVSIANFQPGVFNFAGTGVNSGMDATPTTFAVNTGSIDASATPVGTLLKVDGTANTFGSAPPDFNATAVTPSTSVDSQLIVEWAGGTAAAFTSVSATGIVIDPSAATTHLIRTGPPSQDQLTLPPNMILSTGAVDQTTILLSIGNILDGVNVFNTAAAFATQIPKTLAATGSTLVNKVVAIGRYDAPSNTFNASRIDINVQ